MGDLQIISSSKLSRFPAVLQGISTRKGGVSPEPYGWNLSFHVGDEHRLVVENRRRFFRSLQIEESELAIPHQCHGNTVRRVFSPGEYERTDGLITTEGRVFLVVSVADCIPAFIYDPEKNAVAAVHVGWRGSLEGIIGEAIHLLKRELSSKPENLVVFLGPSARACCYDVGEEVALKFPEKFLQPKSEGKFFLDLPGVSTSHLRENGVLGENIEDDSHCTICTSALFHSYRRDGNRSGRMLGVIGILR